MTMIGTLSFNTNANRKKVYTYLRNRSTLSKISDSRRGDYYLRVHVPTNKTWLDIVQALANDGLLFLNLGAEDEG